MLGQYRKHYSFSLVFLFSLWVAPHGLGRIDLCARSYFAYQWGSDTLPCGSSEEPLPKMRSIVFPKNAVSEIEVQLWCWIGAISPGYWLRPENWPAFVSLAVYRFWQSCAYGFYFRLNPHRAVMALSARCGFKFLVIHSGNFWRSWGFVLYNELKSSSRFWSAKLFSLLERPTHSVSVNRSMHTSDRARCQCDTVVNDANDVLFVVFNNRNSSTRFISLPILRHSKCAGRWISIDSTPLQSFSSAPYPSWTLLSSLL